MRHQGVLCSMDFVWVVHSWTARGRSTAPTRQEITADRLRASVQFLRAPEIC